MNYRLIFNLIGKVLLLETVLLLLPMVTALVYGEFSSVAFAITAAVSFILGLFLNLFVRPKNQFMYAKEGIVVTAFAWILVSLVGALPFVISGGIPSFIDALFEIVSGFTTTGASILTDVESLGKGLLFLRSF